MKRFCYTAHVFTSWSTVTENGLLFCAAKVGVNESPAQIGTHSFSDMEGFTKIRKMSNNVKLSTLKRGEKNINLDYKIDHIHILWHLRKHDTDLYIYIVFIYEQYIISS